MLVEGIEDDVEECDGSAGITSILPHEEYVVGDLWGEVEGFLLLVLLLGRCLLIEEEYAECRLGDHF